MNRSSDDRVSWLRESPVLLWLLISMSGALIAVWSAMAIYAFGP